MLIGLTYDLRDDYLNAGFSREDTAEFDSEDVIRGLEEALDSMNFRTERIGNIRSLIRRLDRGDTWDLVFNIAEGLRGFGREAQVPSLLDAYDIPYTFSDPLVLALTLHKGMTKRIIRDLGIPTPDFHVVETPADAEKVRLPLPLFAKPVAEGTGKGIDGASKITRTEDIVPVCRGLLNRFRQPVLVETFLPGREFTVGITGTGEKASAIGVMEVLLRQEAEQDAYSFLNKEQFEDLVEYRLVEDSEAKKAKAVALAAWKGLGCRDAGRVDLRSDGEGNPGFIEVNPLAGLHPGHSDLPILCYLAGRTYRELIEMIIESAEERLQEKGHGGSHDSAEPSSSSNPGKS